MEQRKFLCGERAKLDLGERYGGIDGLRTYAVVGVVIMHIKENGFSIPGFISERIIGEMGNFVFLFMVISAFSMSCGYYDKIVENKISITAFYGRRFAKMWPYFALLCIIDVFYKPSFNALYELFANLTLCFGLLPNADISVIGVGWFLGLVFVFYYLFPFFCYLISNKKRAWFSFGIAFAFNLICQKYFFDRNHMGGHFDPRTSIVYCAVYFLAGGLIYVYRNSLVNFFGKYRVLSISNCIMGISIYILLGKNIITLLFLAISLTVYAISASHSKWILQNRITLFISKISMELYLGHMMFYRFWEKMNLLHIFENEVLSYFLTIIFVLAGTIIFALLFQWGSSILKTRYRESQEKSS